MSKRIDSWEIGLVCEGQNDLIRQKVVGEFVITLHGWAVIADEAIRLVNKYDHLSGKEVDSDRDPSICSDRFVRG